MSTPYLNFWIIVGMTTVAVVFANMSAKPKLNRTSSYSGTSQPSTTNIPSPIDPTIFEAPKKTELDKAAVQTPSLHQVPPAQPPQVAREFRSIEGDIKTAFDAATQVALAMPYAKGSETAGSASNEHALPSLPSKEIRVSPQIAAAPSSNVDTAPQPPSEAQTAKTTTNLNLREGPGPQYLLIDTLPTDTSVNILETEASWVRIRVKDSGRVGWVNPRYLAKN